MAMAKEPKWLLHCPVWTSGNTGENNFAFSGYWKQHICRCLCSFCLLHLNSASMFHQGRQKKQQDKLLHCKSLPVPSLLLINAAVAAFNCLRFPLSALKGDGGRKAAKLVDWVHGFKPCTREWGTQAMALKTRPEIQYIHSSIQLSQPAQHKSLWQNLFTWQKTEVLNWVVSLFSVKYLNFAVLLSQLATPIATATAIPFAIVFKLAALSAW